MKNIITNADKDERNVITQVRINGGSIYVKEDIVTHIRIADAKYFVKGPQGDVPVRVVAEKYLRSDANETPKDNLGNLPPC